MPNKNNIQQIEKTLTDKKIKKLAMLAPSFTSNFEYPKIITMLKKLGFNYVTELTFGAKMINREYHKQLKDSKEMIISTVCPGIVATITQKYPQYKKYLTKIDSPMTAMAKICRQEFKDSKIIFISPCHFKKIEAESSKEVDYVIDYVQLQQLFDKYKIRKPIFYRKQHFDKFYNDYTKIYPLAGGLSKTAHLKNVIKPGEEKIIDGIADVEKFLNNPKKGIKFLDVNFCVGGCIGGPCTDQKITLKKKRKKLIKYLNKSLRESISKENFGSIKKAKKIKFFKNGK
jgi:iron only hydrogenase large subunit-like protein